MDDIALRIPKRRPSQKIASLSERNKRTQLKVIQHYLNMGGTSVRSSDIDNSNRPMSILDELEALQVYTSVKKDALMAGNVWGDIHRNTFLKHVRDPPQGLTPGESDGEKGVFHEAIKVEKLKQSKLWESLLPPDQRKPEGSIAPLQSNSDFSGNKSLLVDQDGVQYLELMDINRLGSVPNSSKPSKSSDSVKNN